MSKKPKIGKLKIRNLSEKELREYLKAFKELRTAGTPKSGNICKKRGCGGNVVKQVRSLFRGKYSYDQPACEKCGRSYMYAEDVPASGIEEFERILNEPYTI